MRFVYFGSPDFSAYVLESISSFCRPDLVVTQVDKPTGRGGEIRSTPVAATAEKLKLAVLKVDKRKDLEKKSMKSLLQKCDFALVYAFGFIIPKSLLDLPRYGFFNIHPSLLPKFRGASPIVYPLGLGYKKTGVSIIKMDEKLDHGPIIFQAEACIEPEESRDDLSIKLSKISAVFLKKYFQQGLKKLKLFEQNHKSATYTRRLVRQDGYVKLSVLKASQQDEDYTFSIKDLPDFLREYLQKYPDEPAGEISLYSLFRALHPWPGIWSEVVISGKRKRLKVISVDKKNKIKAVQLEGKRSTEISGLQEYLEKSGVKSIY